jgi:hypothetical protein
MNIPFQDLIQPLSEGWQDVQPARLRGRVVTLRVPARTTPSRGVSLAALGAVLPAPGPFGAQSKGRSLGRVERHCQTNVAASTTER